MNILSFLDAIVQEKLAKQPPGIFCVCSANPYVLRSCMQIARTRGFPLVIETTCNQVNQYGGYTHQTPAEFVKYVQEMAADIHLPADQILLGGDHLGPFAWKNEPAASAMEKSIELVRHYVRAGYKKIHLDTSVSCLDDPSPLPKETVMEREALLCKAAVNEIEALGQDLADIAFVVGTEVPTAGGAAKDEETVLVSSVEETAENIELTRKTFIRHGLEAAWERTLAFVVQPGVEFSDTAVHAYDRAKAKPLSRLIEGYDHLVFEAHSTDYQNRTHLQQLVSDHFAFSKVGPALTFALREALFALADIEAELYGGSQFRLSDLKRLLEQRMTENPEHWVRYYSGSEADVAFKRRYSFLDRSRYYLTNPKMEEAIRLLISNLTQMPIPLSLTSQFLPDQYRKVKEGRIENRPLDLINGKITDVVEDYLFACNFH